MLAVEEGELDQPRLEAGVGDGRVPEIRRGDDDRLQIFFVREQVLVVFVGGAAAELRPQRLGASRKIRDHSAAVVRDFGAPAICRRLDP